MITFLRRIRQNLINSNKLSKYLLYALGEIVLVMIGILLALQINTWNENRKLKAKTKDYLLLLKEDLNKERENVNTQIDFVNDYFSRFEIYLEASKNTTTIKDIAVLLADIRPTTLTPTYKIDVVDALNTTGDIKLIPAEIRKKIADLTQQQVWVEKFVARNNRMHLEQMRALGIRGWSASGKRLSNNNKEMKNEIAKRRNNRSYWADLVFSVDHVYNTLYFTQKEYVVNYIDMVKDIDELTQMVEEELRQNY
jgi:hypothetical protein